MHKTGKQLLSLMFKPGETICVGHNKFGYHSVPLDMAINGPITLVPPADNIPTQYPKPEELILVALNPIKGFRQDINCTAFRSFLVEMDYGPMPEQLAYVKKMGMPYSAVVFSGNKSLHFLINLSSDLPSENVYRKFSEWILSIMTLADQNTKNPSRSIRIPGAYREPGKKQLLVEFKGPVNTADMVAWLKKFPDNEPKEKEKHIISENPDISKIKDWVALALKRGIVPPDRNKQWFTIACEFAIAGYDDEETILKLERYFTEERDFKRKEWLTTLRSGFKYAHTNKRA